MKVIVLDTRCKLDPWKLLPLYPIYMNIAHVNRLVKHVSCRVKLTPFGNRLKVSMYLSSTLWGLDHHYYKIKNCSGTLYFTAVLKYNYIQQKNWAFNMIVLNSKNVIFLNDVYDKPLFQMLFVTLYCIISSCLNHRL